ncbi:hemagglutinin repeat-containing protein [Pandoraea sp. CB10b_02]|uniref:hemagglutinin repeat-containing protein n=1 Tax=Pandoraea sp. CB10b_02 TaxID=2014535 RepID=UPI00257CE1B7|nr:hemagglutinin repeat-containing protein [Pandoraea sp. CB10b_02]
MACSELEEDTRTVRQSQTVGTRDGQNGGSDVITQHVGSAIAAGGSLATASGRDTTISGSTISAGGSATVLAGNDVTITAFKDSHLDDEYSCGGSLQFTKSSFDEAVSGAPVMEVCVSKVAKLIRTNISVGAYEKAYSVGRDTLQEPGCDRENIIAALCELTAQLRSVCMELAVQKIDFGTDYDALESLLRKTNELTGQDMYGLFKAM